MRFDLDEALRAKQQRLGQWHRWFAWRPVIMENEGKRVLVWLEHVDRKMVLRVTSGGWARLYR